nr:transporter substrate-binding domain-containing protein [uncultured Duganella sp.]
MDALRLTTLLAGSAMMAAAPAQPGPVLRLSANTWPPYMAPTLPHQGIAAAIVLTALARAGHPAEISYMPWSRALASAYMLRSDGVVGVWLTSQRRARLVYSDSYLTNELYLFHVRRERCPDRAPDASIGVGRDYDYSDDFLARYGKAIKPVDNIKQNLQKLQLGRIDVMLEDRRAVEYTALQYRAELNGMTPAKCTAQPLLSLPLHFGINRDYPHADAIIQAFNVQLKAMKKDGTLDAIVQRHQP